MLFLLLPAPRIVDLLKSASGGGGGGAAVAAIFQQPSFQCNPSQIMQLPGKVHWFLFLRLFCLEEKLVTFVFLLWPHFFFLPDTFFAFFTHVPLNWLFLPTHTYLYWRKWQLQLMSRKMNKLCMNILSTELENHPKNNFLCSWQFLINVHTTYSFCSCRSRILA